MNISHANTSHKKQANFFISIHTMESLKKSVPLRQQSFFVEKAIEKELRRKNLLNALQESAGAWKDEDHPETTKKFIRSLRQSKRI